MSQDPELLIASLLQKALDTKDEPSEETSPEVDLEVSSLLGTAAYLRDTNRAALLSQNELQALAEEVQREAENTQQASPEEVQAAAKLQRALEGEGISGDAQVEAALSAASFLQNSKQALGADFLLQLGQEVEKAARESLSEPTATQQEEQAADVLRQVLDGNFRVVTSPVMHKQVEEALGAAAFLRNAQKTSLLSPEQLTDIKKEVEQEAKQRVQRRRRIAFVGGASFLAIAASVFLLLGPIFRGPKQATLDAKFPTPPTLEQEILPGSDPLERLDPMYEAGLRGMREARFLGAHYASQNAH